MTSDFPPEFREAWLKQCPINRFSEPEDIAQGALFLLSDAARQITGEILDVNGGMFMD